MNHQGIGFIGIGNMGWGMAANLAKVGFNLKVYDTDAARTERFSQEFGALGCKNPEELEDRKIIITMLPTGAIVREILSSGKEHSLASRLATGSIIVDMSSSEPISTRLLGDFLAQSGVALVDAPVSGGMVRANSGQLSIMVGTDDELALEQTMPVLKAMGERIFRTGLLGSGHAMKALNNYVAAATFSASSEALSIGEKFGLDQNTMVDILNVSTGRNFHTDGVLKNHVVGGKFATGFAVGLLAKDVKIAAELGQALAENAPLLDLMQKRWFQARDQQGAAADYTTAHLAWTKAN